MIMPLIEAARRRTGVADAALKSDETTTLHFRAGRLTEATTAWSEGVNLRVVSEGRLGLAGGTEGSPELVLELALASARAGEPVHLTLPRQVELPAVVTHAPRAAAATVPELAAVGALLRDRLAAERVDLNLTLERSLGSVRVANTLGLDAAYDVSRVSLAIAVARLQAGRRVRITSHLSGVDLPTLTELETVVARLRQRLAWAEREAEVTSGRQSVGFLPGALPALLLPVEQALIGKAAVDGGSPLARRRGSAAFSTALTLRDDPLEPGRPGSRPVDDEGIPSRPLTLIEAGVIEALVYDLETAGRIGASPTGHGRRSTYGKPQAAYSNLLVDSGEAEWEQLLQAIGEGLLVERLRGDGEANLTAGAFARGAALAWRVSGGEIVGLVPEVTVAGNAHDLLGRVVAVGRQREWWGSRAAPMIVVDGVSVF